MSESSRVRELSISFSSSFITKNALRILFCEWFICFTLVSLRQYWIKVFVSVPVTPINSIATQWHIYWPKYRPEGGYPQAKKEFGTGRLDLRCMSHSTPCMPYSIKVSSRVRFDRGLSPVMCILFCARISLCVYIPLSVCIPLPLCFNPYVSHFYISLRVCVSNSMCTPIYVFHSYISICV